MLKESWIIILLFWGILFSQNERTVEIASIEIGGLEISGFSLNTDKKIEIEGEGAGQHGISIRRNIMTDPNNMLAYAWILNAKTREMVWRMSMDNTKRIRGNRINRKCSDEIRLPAGDYEVYYSAIPPYYGGFDNGFFSLGKLFNKLFGGRDWDEKDSEKWYVKISDVDEKVNAASIQKYHKARQNQAVISITGLKNSEFRQEGFRLTKRGKFRIYAIGEVGGEEVFDYSWIIDASNSEKVWESTAENGEYAGGARKNREWHDTITLDPGEYWVYSVMDDTHSPGEWNANPPYDPDFYGITINGVKGEFDSGSAEKLLKVLVKPIVELTKITADENVSEGFRLNEPMRLRIYALGEGRNGEMFDYGWITNAETGERMWEMSYDRTRDGGGSHKNRLIDEVVTFPQGSYMVHYRTDGSHNYGDWNAAMPYNPARWGITVYPADPRYTGQEVEKLEKSMAEPDIICQIVQVGSGDHIQKRFRLDQATRVRVYAIGEGDWDEMYDFGWIEDEANGQRIWEMTYNKTRHAGGAKKNRQVDQIIMLDRGSYVLHFKTDNTHDYNDWNDDPPDDWLHYGITLYQME